MTAAYLIVGFCALTLLSGCPQAMKDPIQDEARRILSLPEAQRREALARLPPDKQLDVDIYAATAVEPPNILAGDLAPNWRAILPLVHSRMSVEPDDHKLTAYMMVLFAISASQCSLVERSDILATAERSLSRIQPPLNNVAKDLLKDIKAPHKNLPPCQ